MEQLHQHDDYCLVWVERLLPSSLVDAHCHDTHDLVRRAQELVGAGAAARDTEVVIVDPSRLDSCCCPFSLMLVVVTPMVLQGACYNRTRGRVCCGVALWNALNFDPCYRRRRQNGC